MKNTLPALLGFILLSTPLAATAQQFGDFTYTNDCCAVTITGYTGSGGAVTIPATINGLSVTTIGDAAFQNKTSLTSITLPGSVTSIGYIAFWGCTSLTSVTIPGSVTTIGSEAFSRCTSLIAITVDATNASYSSFDGVLFNKSQTTLIECPGGKAGSYAISASVNYIGNWAFAGCTSLTSVTIPASVTTTGGGAFYYCFSLNGVFFKGDAPGVSGNVFDGFSTAIVYYLPGTTGWGATFGGRPAVLWNPLMQSTGPGFGVGPAGFGFNITGTADIPIVVEACTSLATANWVPLQSLNLTNGAFYFSDPNWTNFPARIYRIRSP